MNLAELTMHVQMMNELCNKRGISPSTIEVYSVTDVLWKSAHVEESEKLLKNKKPLSSIEMDALERRELLFYCPTAWEQFQRARGPKT